jgi:hypothetical protein
MLETSLRGVIDAIGQKIEFHYYHMEILICVIFHIAGHRCKCVENILLLCGTLELRLRPAGRKPSMAATWRMTAPTNEALKLQRPLADDALMIVASGEKEDQGGLAA